MRFEFNRKEYERKFLNPGGYVGKIINVIVEGEIIKVYFDIAQGEFKDTYMKEYKQAGGTNNFDASKWSKKAVVNYNFQYYGAKYAFARLLDDLESSNQSFKWNDETNDLKGKLIGVVYKKNSYEDKFGELKEGTDFPEFTTVKNIVDNKYSIDPKEKKETSSNDLQKQTINISDDDIQF